jgi:hypothetical protein
MILLCQEGEDFLLRDSYRLICNHIDQVWDADFIGSFIQSFLNLFFENLGHPDEPFDATISNQPLPLCDIVFTMTHKPWRHCSASHRTCQCGKLHPARGHACKIPIDRHHAIAHREDSGNALTATAGRHRVIDQTIEVVVVDLLSGGFEDKFVDPFPLTHFVSIISPFGTGWFGPVGLISKEALQSIQL